MISIKGKWYDGRTSATEDVVCIVYDNGAIRIERMGDEGLILTRPRFDITVSPRLANTQRYLLFPDGEKLATDDNETVDRIETQFSKPSWLRFVHRLESHWRYVLPALVLLHQYPECALMPLLKTGNNAAFIIEFFVFQI